MTKLQKRVIRILSHSKYNAHSEPLFKNNYIQHKIHQPMSNHLFAKNCICVDIPMTVNNAPNCIIDKIYTHSLQGFSRYTKGHILQSYQENCNIVDCYICTSNIS